MPTERRSILSHASSNSFIQASEALTDFVRTIIYNRYISRMRIWTETSVPVDIFQENKALSMRLTNAYIFGLKSASNLTEDPDKRIFLQNFKLGFSDLFFGY